MTTYPISSLTAGADDPKAPILHLFGGPYLSVGGCRHEVPEGSKRLLALVAIRRGPVERRSAAGTLWPAGDDTRASGNLRSALWRLGGLGTTLIIADRYSLTLCEEIVVDVHVAGDWAIRLIQNTAGADDLVIPPCSADALDLLPGWYDDWALIERERTRQRMLHALEKLSHDFVRTARWAEAVEAAMMAVSAEPLRESAQRALIAAHLGEGNWVEGRRCYAAYRDLVRRELGTDPPDIMADVELSRRDIRPDPQTPQNGRHNHKVSAG